MVCMIMCEAYLKEGLTQNWDTTMIQNLTNKLNFVISITQCAESPNEHDDSDIIFGQRT